MGTISDLTMLVTKLVDRIKDRKAAADLREIQQMIAALQSEQAKLHENNIELRAENMNLREQNLSLQQQLSQGKHSQEQPDGELDEIATKMLVVIANTRRDLTRDMIIQQLGLSKAKGEYHFDQIYKRKLAEATHGQMGVGMFWGTTEEGREYLASHNLLE